MEAEQKGSHAHRVLFGFLNTSMIHCFSAREGSMEEEGAEERERLGKQEGRRDLFKSLLEGPK